MFTKCFTSPEESVDVQFNRWKRKLVKAIHTSFRKIRIKQNDTQKLSKLDNMLNERKKLLKKKSPSDKDLLKLEKIEEKVSIEIADKEFEKLEKALGNLETDSGATDYTNIWKEMRKAYPKTLKPLPTGVMNVMGKVITNPKEKKIVTLDHFAHCMRRREVKKDVKGIIDLNNELFEERLNKSRNIKSPPFAKNELEKVLKGLKVGKSKDPDNLVCELFKIEVIWSDLKESLLVLMNKIKSEQVIPECLKKANITILHKKSNKLDLNNWRGIFEDGDTLSK